MTTELVSADWVGVPVTPKHAAMLAAEAILPEVAQRRRVQSVTTPDELPEDCPEYWRTGNYLPGLLFWVRRPDGSFVPHLRPDNPADPDNKYQFAKERWQGLDFLRSPDEHAGPILMVEGTKQSLAADSYLSEFAEDYALIGMAGVGGWRKSAMPWAEGRNVLIAPDKDATKNYGVWSEVSELQETLLVLEGAASVRIVKVPSANEKDGLSDVLGRHPLERRHILLGRALQNAGELGKAPAKSAGASQARTHESVKQEAIQQGRTVVVVNEDPAVVIQKIVKALKEDDGRSLFHRGGGLAEFIPAEHRSEMVTGNRFKDLLQQRAMTMARKEAKNSEPTYFFQWPDGNCLSAAQAHARDFSDLRRVVRGPFVRQDGTICSAPGYDAASGTYLDLDEHLSVSVPDQPSAEDVARAVKLLIEDLWGDMPFPTQADRAGALATLLTPFVRDRLDLAPLAVVDGSGMGVGKNLWADTVSIILTGQAAKPRPLSEYNDEVRKTITSVLRTSRDLCVFDEAHTLQGTALAQVLTSETWTDRVLGVSEDIELPNTATWIALGNNVRVNGDLRRRVHWVRLRPTYANPQDRPTGSFRHSDLKAWTTENRADLLSACLTLVRAWFAAGCPFRPGRESFGSFHRWEKTVGGILQVAGVDGFLGNLRELREEADVVGQAWAEHLAWLRDAFGDKPFTARDVAEHARRDDGRGRYAAPPELEDVSGPKYARDLGNAYRGELDRSRREYTLRKTGTAHGGAARYAVHRIVGQDDPFATVGGDSGDTGETPSATRGENHTSRQGENHTSRQGDEKPVCVSESGSSEAVTSVTTVTAMSEDPFVAASPTAVDDFLAQLFADPGQGADSADAVLSQSSPPARPASAVAVKCPKSPFHLVVDGRCQSCGA